MINMSVKIQIKINVFFAEKLFIGETSRWDKIFLREKSQNLINKFVIFPQILY